MFNEIDNYQEIRAAVRALCEQFPDEYFRKIDAQRGYPVEFVDALTQAGWLAALIPQEYGGSGLSLAEASVIMEEINRSGRQLRRLPRPDVRDERLVRHGNERRSGVLPKIADRRAAHAVDGGHRAHAVVTLEHAIAAPFATRQLADLGARVIKIERPGVGDFARGYDQRVRGLASHFVWTNRSKESLTLDVKHPQAAALLRRLIVEQADVLVQNLAPGAAARLGLSRTNRCPPRSPASSSATSPATATTAPYRDKKAYDLLIQSEAGFCR
jgi:hypothetical protein